MRIHSICCAQRARFSLLYFVVGMLMLAVCTGQALAGAIMISNTEIRDTWTNSLPDPVNNTFPDIFVRNATPDPPDRFAQIPPFRTVLGGPPEDILTMKNGRGEGTVVANAGSSPGGLHNIALSNLVWQATFGSALLQKNSIVGLVWNYLDVGGDSLLNSHYRFQFGKTANTTPGGIDKGFSVWKRDALGAETILFQDENINLDKLSVYDFAVSGVDADTMHVKIVKVSGPGTPAGILFDMDVDDFAGAPLGPGAVGLYHEDIIDGQWNNIMVPEPSAIVLAGMGVLGLLVFTTIRRRQQRSYDMVL